MKLLTRILFVLALFSLTVNLQAQIKVDFKKKLENQVNRRLNQKTDQAIDKVLDTAEDSIAAGLKKDDSAEQAGNDQNGEVAAGAAAGTAAASTGGQQTALESYSKYDFIPGEKVVFYEDFSQDAVGDFPALWNTNGSAEVVTTNLFPGNWMKFDGDEAIWTDALIKLPDNYTLEFDVIPVKDKEGHVPGFMIRLMQAKNVKAWDGGTVPGNGGFQFHTDYGRPFYSTWLFGTECEKLNIDGYKNDEIYKQKVDQKYHIAIWVQKTRLRLYQNENKVFDLPKAFPTGCVKPDRIRFERGAAMVTNIRIAVGAPDMRNKLMTEGKLVTYGIYFDVNKDVVKPESYGTLKEIATILNEVPDVKVKIVGHTDSDGADAANLDLSKRRAASVKNELVKSFCVNGDRLVTDGAGEGQPVSANDTPANKALNRRVEFIKL
jgi:outer membrane protein OmpA-like peptidoglycan-associated protein